MALMIKPERKETLICLYESGRKPHNEQLRDYVISERTLYTYKEYFVLDYLFLNFDIDWAIVEFGLPKGLSKTTYLDLVWLLLATQTGMVLSSDFISQTVGPNPPDDAIEIFNLISDKKLQISKSDREKWNIGRALYADYHPSLIYIIARFFGKLYEQIGVKLPLLVAGQISTDDVRVILASVEFERKMSLTELANKYGMGDMGMPSGNFIRDYKRLEYYSHVQWYEERGIWKRPKGSKDVATMTNVQFAEWYGLSKPIRKSNVIEGFNRVISKNIGDKGWWSNPSNNVIKFGVPGDQVIFDLSLYHHILNDLVSPLRDVNDHVVNPNFHGLTDQNSIITMEALQLLGQFTIEFMYRTPGGEEININAIRFALTPVSTHYSYTLNIPYTPNVNSNLLDMLEKCVDPNAVDLLIDISCWCKSLPDKVDTAQRFVYDYTMKRTKYIVPNLLKYISNFAITDHSISLLQVLEHVRNTGDISYVRLLRDVGEVLLNICSKVINVSPDMLYQLYLKEKSPYVIFRIKWEPHH